MNNTNNEVQFTIKLTKYNINFSFVIHNVNEHLEIII